MPLQMMGAHIQTQNGRPPVRIRGTPRLRGIRLQPPGGERAGEVRGTARGAAAAGCTRVTEPAPSRDHTERMLGAFGVALAHEGRTIALEGGQTLRGTALAVPADFSSAAFFLVAGCLAAERPLLLVNVGVNPTRTGLLELLRRMGADIRVHPRASAAGGDAEPVADIEVRRSRLRGISVPEALVPLAIDEFPVFFIAAACASGETLVRGALELRVKESDRLAAMADGLAALGVEHQLLPDGLWIRGAETLNGGAVDSRGDHRIAMAFAVAALQARAPDRDRGRRKRRDQLPGFCGHRGRGGPADRGHVTVTRCLILSDSHHRRPERLGQGHYQPRDCAARGLAPARQRRALPPGGARRHRGGRARGGCAAPRRAGRAHATSTSLSHPTAASESSSRGAM